MDSRRVVILLIPLGVAVLGVFLILLGLAPVSASVQGSQEANSIGVNTLVDEEFLNGNCSLREAITAANFNYTVDKCSAGGVMTDTITFSKAGTIWLTGQLPHILNAGPLVIDGGSVITISGGGRILWVNPDARLQLLNLTLSNAELVDSAAWPNGGGLYNQNGHVVIHNSNFINNRASSSPFTYGSGGGIYNEGTITITLSTFMGNMTYEGVGGAIENEGRMTIRESTFHDNISGVSAGGAVYNSGSMYITSSSFLRNQGGALFNSHSGWLSVTNTMFSNNSSFFAGGCGSGGGTLHNYGWAELNYSTVVDTDVSTRSDGTNICNFDSGILTLKNSLLTTDPVDTNCYGTITDGGYNIDSQDTCGFDPANDSLVNTDPLLGELQNNGGPTWIYAPLAGSPAIDAANPVSCPATDQRGVPRPFDGDGDGDARCDIGSYEVVPAGIPRATRTDIASITPDLPMINNPVSIDFEVSSVFGVPTGTVTVTIENHPESCTGTLNNGHGSCSIVLEEVGIYTLTASFGGGNLYLPSADVQSLRIVSSKIFLPVAPQDHPYAVQVIGVSFNSGDRGISYYMQGMLKNISDSPVYSVTVTAYLFDEAGFLDGVYTTTTILPAIFPGQNMPFRPVNLGFYQPPPDSYMIIPSYSYHSSREYRSVTVLSQEISNPSYDYVSISGEIRNNQDVELRSIKVIVMPGGPYTLYAYASLGADTLLPGETTPYTLTERCTYYPMNDPCPTEFSVQGQGYVFP